MSSVRLAAPILYCALSLGAVGAGKVAHRGATQSDAERSHPVTKRSSPIGEGGAPDKIGTEEGEKDTARYRLDASRATALIVGFTESCHLHILKERRSGWFL